MRSIAHFFLQNFGHTICIIKTFLHGIKIEYASILFIHTDLHEKNF